MKRHENGFTLTEVLAGIVLLSIIIILISILLVHTFNSDKTATKTVSLKQDTNIMISQLRKDFYNPDGSDTICFDTQNDRVNIDKSGATTDNGRITTNDSQTCLEKFDRKKPMKLKLTAHNNSDHLKIETTLVKGGYVDLDNSYNQDPCIVPTIDWSSVELVDTLPCTSNGNVIWTGNKLAHGCGNGDKHVIDGNLQISNKVNGISKNAKIHVKKNLYAKGQAHFENARLTVDGNALFEDQFHFLKNNIMNVEKGVCFDNRFKALQNSEITIKGTAKFKVEGDLAKSEMTINGDMLSTAAPFQILDKGSLTVGNNASFYGAEIHPNSIVTVKKDLRSTTHPFQLLANGILTVGSNASFHGAQVHNNARMKVGGNLESKESEFQLNKGYLKVYKDATFSEFNPDSPKEFCIKGNVSGTDFDNTKPCTYPAF